MKNNMQIKAPQRRPELDRCDRCVNMGTRSEEGVNASHGFIKLHWVAFCSLGHEMDPKTCGAFKSCASDKRAYGER